MINRRHFIGASGVLALGRVCMCQADQLRVASKVKPPYRVWFQPRCFHRDMSLYPPGASAEVEEHDLGVLAGFDGHGWLFRDGRTVAGVQSFPIQRDAPP